MRGEIDELTVNSEALTKSKLNIERASRTLEDNIGEMRTKIEENSKIKSELDQERARNEKDIADLKRKIEEVDGQNAQVSHVVYFSCTPKGKNDVQNAICAPGVKIDS